MADHDTGVDFAEVWQRELEEIGTLRQSRGLKSTGQIQGNNEHSSPLVRLAKQAFHSHVTGLAFSGGGIRSATFNLGVLQGLAQGNCLRGVDYLSTVSGGGYIGSWLVS
jgi:predicted acylesterase/phospholipase RssA